MVHVTSSMTEIILELAECLFCPSNFWMINCHLETFSTISIIHELCVFLKEHLLKTILT